VARDKIANVLLAYKGKHNHGGAARAAEDIARQMARELLGPLLDCACSRLALVVRRVFDIAAERSVAAAGARVRLRRRLRRRLPLAGVAVSAGVCVLRPAPAPARLSPSSLARPSCPQPLPPLPAAPLPAPCAAPSGSPDSLKPYVAFHAALRAAHQSFLCKTEEAARQLVHHHLASATSEFALSLMASLPDFWDDEQGAGRGEAAAAAAEEEEQQEGRENAAGAGGQVRRPEGPVCRAVRRAGAQAQWAGQLAAARARSPSSCACA
jgi:hypothetical protein